MRRQPHVGLPAGVSPWLDPVPAGISRPDLNPGFPESGCQVSVWLPD